MGRALLQALSYKAAPQKCFVNTFQEAARKSGAVPNSRAAPIVTLPRAGERFSDEELNARYGVPIDGSVRVSRTNRCMVLVHPAGARPGNADADRATDILYTGESSGPKGVQNTMSDDNFALARSKEDGYTVLHFAKEGDALVFNSRVEYVSHEFKAGADVDGLPRTVIEFKMRVLCEASALRQPADGTRTVAAVDQPRGALRGRPGLDTVNMIEHAISLHSSLESKDHLIRALPCHVDAPVLDRALEHLRRSLKIAIVGDSIHSMPCAGGSSAADGRAFRRERDGAAGTGPNFAGTFLEGIGDDRAPDETVGDYIVRLVNTDEPGAFDSRDAKEIDEGLRRMARGECCTYEQMRKEFCP